MKINIITTCKRSLGQGNIFRSVCQEFCPQVGGSTWAGTTPLGRCTPLGRYPWQVHPPGGYTPQDQVHPPGPGTPPRTRYTPWHQVHPLAGTPQDQVNPPGRYTPRTSTPPPGRYTLPRQCMMGDTGNKRAVRILLECILVSRPII